MASHQQHQQEQQEQDAAPPSQSYALRDLAGPSGQQQQDGTQGSSTGTGAGQLKPPGPTTFSSYWDQSPIEPAETSPRSPIDAAALQSALPPGIYPPSAQESERPASAASNPYSIQHTPYYDEEPDRQDYFESDSAPLTSLAQPISGVALATPQSEQFSRTSFQTVSDLGENQSPRPRDTNMLGFDLEPGYNPNKQSTYGNTLSPQDQRVSRSPGALTKAGSIVRAMSQRVVNISGEAESVEERQRRARSRSRSPSADGRGPARPSHLSHVDTSQPTEDYPPSPVEKKGAHEFNMTEDVPPPTKTPMPNPLKGRSLGIFGPDNPIRLKLCDLLVHPAMEPAILLLIVLQAILLTVESAHSVFTNPRPKRWGESSIDYPMLGLFVIFTLELAVRIIVSGFILNATEYSTVDRSRGIRAVVTDKYQTVFGPQRSRSVRSAREDAPGPSTFERSFSVMHGQRLPETVEEAQRMQLARRAFLRHGFNRLDFTAVVSFWITFVLSLSGIESQYHMYVFRMMSCLRIVRLLALTNGTAIILRSLKKAAPLLIRVSFLIFFFWILFAIIGVQSFKSSLSRQCVWINPSDPKNLTAAYVNEMQFCGGYLDNTTGAAMPWVTGSLDNLSNGTTSSKGFLCPRGSLCLQIGSPYNDTVNFDNIAHSMELVFVIMSANTWSDLMHYTTYSDYLPAALFFGAGIMIMMLWMTNLLIAVITSSFQVIREESKSSAFTTAPEPVGPDEEEVPIAPQPVGKLQQFYDKTRLFWVLLITFDLLTQAFRSNIMHEDRANFIKNTEIIVTALLDVEIILRVAANWRGFHRSYRNLFDLFLAVTTTVILIPPIPTHTTVSAWLSAFQILRVYRVVLAIPVTRKLILLVLGNATGIANLMLFVFLITFLMAILAVQLFRGEIPMYDDGGNLNQVSFYTMFNSFLGMYQILSSENWTSILYSVTSYTTAKHTSWFGAMFLLAWFTLAFFIIVNMFIAVIQENFDVSEDEKRLEQVKAFLQRKELGSNSSNLALSSIFTFGKHRRRRDPLDYGPATMEMLLKDAVVRDFLDDMDPLQQGAEGVQNAPQGHGDVSPGLMSTMWGKFKSIFTSKEPNPFYSNIQFGGHNDTQDPRQMARQAVTATSARRKAQREYLARHPTYNNALYVLTPKNPIRRLCQKLVGPGRGSERFDGVEPNKIAWYTFSAFIYAAIVAMVILACVTTPLYQKVYMESHTSTAAKWFVWVDMGFTSLFTFEAIIKVIADGLFFTPNAYFRSSWGIIDGLVLITLWINVLTLLANDGAVSRAVGAFKALRALRLLNVSDSARDTFHSLIIVGGWKILSAAFVSISLLIPFAIYALNLFSGKLNVCNDGNVTNLTDCFGEYQANPYSSDWPMLAPRVADNPYFDFDDFGSSLFTLYQIVSQEGWVDVSFAVQAITGTDTQPQDGVSQGNAVFFVVFNLLATVFILTLFISVFMRNYTEQTGVAFLTAEQRAWLELRKLLRQISPSKSSYDDSEKKWKKWCHKRAIEKRGKWYTAVTGVLVLHLILLMLEFYPEPNWWSITRDAAFLLFTLIYMANISIRIIGLGWARFRKSSWDVYSLVAVSGTFATSILLLSDANFEPYIQLHKFFLVSILLLLIPRNDALDQLFKTAAASLTTIINLLATWLVFFLVFAIALTQTFSLTRFGDNEEGNINFRTVPKALILLFRFSAGEGWNEMMEDFANIVPPLCTDAADFSNSDCGSTAWARVLFIAWNLVSMYIFVNLFISLIYESFSYVYQRSSGLANIDRDEIRRFKEAWRSVDPAGTGFISKEAFPRLLGELSGVFEMRIYDAEDSIGQILEDVRNDATQPRHASMASASTTVSGIDIRKLNERIAKIDVEKVRERRRRFKLFFEEVMVSADPDRGISFTTVLMILAHYNVISDSKSLKLEEFLRRRARLQRVEEEVRRRIVLGFFDTLYYVRKFKKHLDKKKSGRMTAVPQLDIPDIFVEDGEGRERPVQRTTMAGTPRRSATSPSGHLALPSPDLNRPGHHSWSSSADIGTYDANYTHPLSLPRSPPSMPGSHRSASSAFSFELSDAGSPSGEEVRRGSSVSPAQVRELLDDSVWVESIRRTATVRKSMHRSKTERGARR